MAKTISSAWPIGKFLCKLAGPEPVPGGGATAALTGALGCGLGSMVGRILLERPRLTATRKKQLRLKVRALDRAASRLTQLMSADAAAYQAWLLAAKTGRGKGKARRAAIRCPMQICDLCTQAAASVTALSRKESSSLRSDLSAARSLLKGAFGAAEATALVNLGGMKASEAAPVRRELKRLRKRLSG